MSATVRFKYIPRIYFSSGVVDELCRRHWDALSVKYIDKNKGYVITLSELGCTSGKPVKTAILKELRRTEQEMRCAGNTTGES